MDRAISIRGRKAALVPAEEPVPLFTLADLLFWIYLYPIRKIALFMPPGLLHGIARAAEPVMQFQARQVRSKASEWMVASGCASPGEAAKLAREFLSSRFSQYIGELALLRGGPLPCDGIEGKEHYERAVAEKKGVILLTGHFARNRLAAAYLTRNGQTVVSVHNQNPPNHRGGRLGRRLMRRFAEIREQAYPHVLYIQDPQSSLKILQTLRSGGTVKIQPDGVPGNKFVESQFLGISRRVPVGIFDLIRISGCAVVPMMTRRCGRSFRIQFSERLSITAAATREDFISANLPVLLGTIEKQVREHPEQWLLWTHQ